MPSDRISEELPLAKHRNVWTIITSNIQNHVESFGKSASARAKEGCQEQRDLERENTIK
jgi:hypothetical protein